jgi:hypothetical protein
MENDTLMPRLFTVSEKEGKNGIFIILSSTNLVVKKV